MKNSAPSRELQPRSDWKVLVPVGAGSPLLLAHAVTDAHLAFSSQKYVAIKLLLFLFLCCSCWHFCQPCTGFLSVLLVLGLHPCCPSLSACLPWGCWEGSGSGVLMPLPWCMNANNLVTQTTSVVPAPLKGSQLSPVLGLAGTALGPQLVVGFLLCCSCRWYCSDVRWICSMK